MDARCGTRRNAHTVEGGLSHTTKVTPASMTHAGQGPYPSSAKSSGTARLPEQSRQAVTATSCLEIQGCGGQPGRGRGPARCRVPGSGTISRDLPVPTGLACHVPFLRPPQCAWAPTARGPQQPASNGDAQRRTWTDGEGVRNAVGERERTRTDVCGLASGAFQDRRHRACSCSVAAHVSAGGCQPNCQPSQRSSATGYGARRSRLPWYRACAVGSEGLRKTRRELRIKRLGVRIPSGAPQNRRSEGSSRFRAAPLSGFVQPRIQPRR